MVVPPQVYMHRHDREKRIPLQREPDSQLHACSHRIWFTYLLSYSSPEFPDVPLLGAKGLSVLKVPFLCVQVLRPNPC